MLREKERSFFIKDMIGEVHLETFPGVANQILMLLEDENISIYELTKVASHDIYIAATIIRLANSPFYGLKNKVAELMQAISIIGLDSTKRLMLTISARSMFKDYNVFNKLLWEHMVAVAIVCQNLSFKFDLFSENISYLAGLMHDIGKLVMYKSKKINYEVITEKVDLSSDILSFEAELDVYKFSHCDVAKVMLKLWNFDDLIIEAIRLHHDSHFVDEAAEKLAAIINFSDYVVNWIGIGRTKPYRKIILEELESFKFLKLNIDDFGVFLNEIEKRINFSKGIF